MSAPDSSASGCCSLRVRPILAGSALGLVAAVAWSIFAGPTYEATAHIEVAVETGLPTLEEKLHFLSVYREVAGDDDAAIDLKQRTRVKNRRGSRLLGVTVSHQEPAVAADEANRIAGAFLASLVEPKSSVALPDPSAADSPESLAEAWTTQSAEFEKLSARYQNDAAHPAVAGARQRLDALSARIVEQVAALRERLGLPAFADQKSDPGSQLAALKSEIARLGKAAPFPPSPACRLAEPAAVPLDPVGPGRVAIWLGGAVLGAFGAGLWLWCCPGCCDRR
jgi:uncharacterized protein involved in exopolysaccharide biosynthesis